MITEKDKEETLQYALNHPGMGVDHAGRCYMDGLLAERERVKVLVEALEYYADKDNWKYTDSAGPFDWYATINSSDTELSPGIGEGGGIDYAGKRARQALSAYKETHNV